MRVLIKEISKLENMCFQMKNLWQMRLLVCWHKTAKAWLAQRLNLKRCVRSWGSFE